MLLPRLTSIYIYFVFFLISSFIELRSFDALSPSEQEIVANRKKLPFMTDIISMFKVLSCSLVILFISPWQMRYKTYLYSNSQELVFIYHIFMVFFIIAFVPIIKYLQNDIRNIKIPKWYLQIVLIGDYIHLWGILLACYLSIPGF